MIEWLRSKLAEVLQTSPESLPVDGRFGEDIDCDSIDFIEVVHAAEAHYDRDFPLERVAEAKTLTDLARILEEHLSSSG